MDVATKADDASMESKMKPVSNQQDRQHHYAFSCPVLQASHRRVAEKKLLNTCLLFHFYRYIIFRWTRNRGIHSRIVPHGTFKMIQVSDLICNSYL